MVNAVIEGELYSFGTPWQRGGEADVYQFRPQARFIARHGNGPFVAKIYRVGKSDAQQRADDQRQTKLRDFPVLPDFVASPVALIFNTEGRVIGYVMVLIADVTPLIKFKRREFRQKHGISIFRVLRIFARLKGHVRTLHARGVIIGDFNDKNVLIGKNDEVYLIDADNFQFGIYRCVALVPGFADSRIVRLRPNDAKDSLQQVASFDELSDWLALEVMLCQVLLGTNPQVGGICTEADSSGKLLQGNRRLVAGVSIFHPSVQLSDVATPLSVLPEALRSRWERVFSPQAERGEIPDELLDPATWVECTQCQTEHGRLRCPICDAPGVASPAPRVAQPAPSASQQVVSPGIQIVAAAYHGDMRYLAYQDGTYCREDDTQLLKGSRDNVQTVISGERTIFVRGSRFVVIDGSGRNSVFETHTANGVAANSRHVYWVSNNSLVRDNGSATIGSVPSHMTSVWAGERFGVAVVQAGVLNQIRTFDAEGTGFTGTLNLPVELGTIADVHCVVGDELAWVTMLVRTTYGAEIVRCFVVDHRAQLIASAEARPSSTPWLDAFTAATAVAVRDKLVVAVAGVGLVRIGIAGHTPCVEKTRTSNKDLVTKEATVGLFFTDQGLLHVSPTTVTTVS